MDVMIQRFSNICRFCSNNHAYLKPIFKDDGQNDSDINPNVSIINIVEVLLGININISDELPKFMCTLCYDKLISSYIFRQQCLSTIKNLKEMLNDHKQFVKCQDQQEVTNTNNLILIDNNNITITKLEFHQELDNINKISNNNSLERNKSDSGGGVDPNKLKLNKLNSSSKNNRKIKIPTNVASKKDNILLPMTIADMKTLSLKKKEKTSICSICGETRTNMLTHMQRMHATDGPFECDFCGKIFKGKPPLKHHLRIHSNIRKYKCKICDQAYVDCTSLRVHMLNHTNVRKYKCKICDKSFKQSCALGVHIKTHTQERKFQCDFCTLRFLTLPHKKKHEIIHKNLYPYKCEFCSKSFNSGSTLSSHRFKVHTKLNPYICEICSKTFTHRIDFNTHKRQHEYKII